MKAKSPPSCPPESLRAVRSSHTTILRTCTDTGLLQLFAADMHHVLRICTTCGVPLRNSQRSVTKQSTRSTYAPTSLLRHGLHRARAYRQLACLKTAPSIWRGGPRARAPLDRPEHLTRRAAGARAPLDSPEHLARRAAGARGPLDSPKHLARRAAGARAPLYQKAGVAGAKGFQNPP